ncbi:MAG TPA: LysR substrate-binding domain-containing protein [Burkholderiaceae bacterium]|nr:LysR substrate-binding domain-containing protein [Burkholderiaceae bacterium]
MQKPLDRLPPLDLLATFEAAARHLSFTRAAAERFVTQSAVSRQIRALEDELGVPLFERRHRALRLTEGGARLFGTCTAVLGQLRGTVRELRAPTRREVLSLTTTPGLAAFWLIPRLPGFTREHPGIDVRLDASFEMRQLAADGFDLAIRYARVGAVRGESLFHEAAMPVCSPRLLRRLPLARPEDLAAHTLLQLNPSVTGGAPVEWEPWLQATGLAGLEPAARLSFSSYSDVITATLAGQGIAMGRRPLVDDLVKKRQLVAPFGDSRSTQRSYVLVVDPAAGARPAVRAFAAWLLAQARGAAGPAPARRR